MKINKSQLLLHSVKRLLDRNSDSNIRRLLVKCHPSEIAGVVRQLDPDSAVRVVLALKDSEREPQTFSELGGHFMAEYIRITEQNEHVASILEHLPHDEAAALLSDIDKDVSDQILSLMRTFEKQEVKELLQYGEDQCGRIMAVDILSLNQDMTAAEAIAAIQSSTNQESLYYLYVVDDLGVLVGVVSLRQVLQVTHERVLSDFMTRDVVRVNVFDSQRKAARFVEEYNFVSLPVVDDQGELMGMVTVDDVIDLIRDEAKEDVLELAGVDPDAIEDFSFWPSLASRFVWYSLLFIGGIICYEFLHWWFKDLSPNLLFIGILPLVMRLGGGISTQAVTFVCQSLLNKNIERARAWRAFWGQARVLLVVSFLMSMAMAAYQYFRMDYSLRASLISGGALIVVSSVSLFLGLLTPLLLSRFKIDTLLVSSRLAHFLMDAINMIVFVWCLSFI